MLFSFARCLLRGGRWTPVWFLPGVLAIPLAGADKTIVLPRFAYPDAVPALMAAAEQQGLNVHVREVPPEVRKAVAGDELTFLVSLRDGKELKQWVLAARTADLTDKERLLPPLPPFHRYISTGTELKFTGRRAAIETVLIGPMNSSQGKEPSFKPEVKRRRLLVNADYLELGFSAASAGELSLRAANESLPPGKRFSSRIGEKPFPAEVVRANRALAEEVGVTPESEKAFYGSIPALLEFFNLIMRTPGLQDILREVIDVSWWSLLTNGGKPQVRFDYANQHIQKLEDLRPGLPQFVFPVVVNVNNKPAMAVSLIVTDPQAPFATTAGVLGLHAGRPYDHDPQLTVRIIGGRYVSGTVPAGSAK